MASYNLEPTRTNLCGAISREHSPILTIESGDTVHYRTLDAGWGLEPLISPTQERRKFEPRGEHDRGHALIGPVAVQGAKPGTVLEVQIGTIRPGAYGFSVELVSGSNLYLPVTVEGGFFYVGDGHAAQGDGEVSETAIECPMEEVALTFHVHNNAKLSMLRAKTPAGWITFGLHQDLEEAMYIALEEMVLLLQEMLKVERTHALALASVAVDLRITQIVNGVRGVHAVLSHGAIR